MSFPSGSFPAGERLRFRLPSPDDAAFYHRLMNEPDYIRFIADHGVKTIDDASRYIEAKSLARFATFGVGLWVVELKETAEPIGICGLVVRKELTYPDLGFAFLAAFRGRGLGREAGQAVLTLASDGLKLRTLCAITHPDNVRSANLLKKIGFEAHGQRHLTEIGETSDYYLWQQSDVESGLAQAAP
ncbi:GNAT family N-acetyltransferase [Roseibium salinum]|uniref:GNAT family N-acetyltransferase n=1 Tax=Roseibium salinum TaxID=1604349 RepID=A0ABT3R690_9HYPH|nr:GNAT family N-acetyltransferase [Roseibium sp. DSM 29163]MCX2724806.1 GNAT family N-acetyltransferase [Roseibium sp. DSM 29163]